MKIDRIELRQINLPFISPFQTAGGIEESSNSIIVKVTSGGVSGWGESSVSRDPHYIEETTSTVLSIQKEVLAPLIMKKKITNPGDITEILKNVRGNRFAISGLESAVWDLWCKTKKQNLSKYIGGKKERVPVGVSIGIQKNERELISLCDNYLREGYRRIKIKIKPGWDIIPLKSIRERWHDIMLQVDGNCAYSYKGISVLESFDKFNLLMIEQPFSYDDLLYHSVLQRRIKTPVCLDESIVSEGKAAEALIMDACRVINIKPGRVGGILNAVIIHHLCRKNKIPVWCGGMLETGIGRAINVCLASLPGFTLPGDISANSRYFKRDIVMNPFKLNADGTLTVPTIPGHGAIVDERYLNKVTINKIIIK
ncbi:MAG: o-succinylbenzoate synthase [Ignavibacteriaceae bacterium]|nr:o-succinylbenzoate synthase [Ignavibacteriaceae bacterium]